MRWLPYILYIVVKRSNLTQQCEMEYAIIAHGFAAHFSVDAQTKEHGNHQFLINPAEQQHHHSITVNSHNNINDINDNNKKDHLSFPLFYLFSYSRFLLIQNKT